MEREQPYQRRERYKGTHPRNFKDKYKELNPENYTNDVTKIRAQGKTPAGMHIPICVREILDFLQIKQGMIGLDATLGYGGHSQEILKLLIPDGRLLATDVDPLELPKTTARLKDAGFGPEVFTPIHLNFSEIDKVVELFGPLDFVLADLGVSSMQLDNPDRGFSIREDGPLDLRLNPQEGIPASQLIRMMKSEKLAEMLLVNADEPFAEVIAEAIAEATQLKNTPTTTFQLKNLVTLTLKGYDASLGHDEIQKSCQRCFQALRIEVNDEFGALNEFLEKLPASIKTGGRIAILTFHSGEDRRVKKSFKYYANEGVYSQIASDPIKASAEECFQNRRARSAKLRWAIKS
ncbi:MAG: 16S rRNA (cytosine(1402)-N(4))-methyltransferase RsmH [Marinilabiliales bacterium]|nr:16S rRNA (cytosine(1402)-N(4))-methyltransferase RsmH [Marinilabiliales bacterium]